MTSNFEVQLERMRETSDECGHAFYLTKMNEGRIWCMSTEIVFEHAERDRKKIEALPEFGQWMNLPASHRNNTVTV